MEFTKKHLLMLLGGVSTAGLASVATTSNASADTVTVKAGDTTWGLAQEHNSTVDQIVKDNKLADGGKLIYVGQKLAINEVKDNSQQAVAQQSQSQTQPQQANATAANNTGNYQSSQSYSAPQGQASNYTGNSYSSNQANYTSGVSGNEAAAKAWIAARESGGNYNARNGQYIGKYQLSSSYLGGDYSPANQERVADNYVAQRYGSWSNAQAFWQNNGWY